MSDNKEKDTFGMVSEQAVDVTVLDDAPEEIKREILKNSEALMERDTIREAVKAVKDFRDKLEATGITSVQLKTLYKEFAALDSMAQNYVAGLERGEAPPEYAGGCPLESAAYGMAAYDSHGYQVERLAPEYNSVKEAIWCAVDSVDNGGRQAWGLDEIPERVEIYDEEYTIWAVGIWDAGEEKRVWTQTKL